MEVSWKQQQVANVAFLIASTPHSASNYMQSLTINFLLIIYFLFLYTINETLFINAMLKIKAYKIKINDYYYFSNMNNSNYHRAVALYRYNAWMLEVIR